MQDAALVHAWAEAGGVLREALTILGGSPGSPRARGAALSAVDAIDLARPYWLQHFGPDGPAFPLDRLVCLPAKRIVIGKLVLGTSFDPLIPIWVRSPLR